MTSPTSNLHLPDLKPSGAPVRLPSPTEPDLSKEEPEADPEEQAQHMSFLVKDILRHRYKDDPFLCNLLDHRLSRPQQQLMMVYGWVYENMRICPSYVLLVAFLPHIVSGIIKTSVMDD